MVGYLALQVTADRYEGVVTIRLLAATIPESGTKLREVGHGAWADGLPGLRHK